MSKHLTSQRYIFKINTARLKRAKWDIKSLTVDEARKNQELIALADSQMLRFIDEINGVTNCEQYISSLKDRIALLKEDPNQKKVSREIYLLKKELDELLFKKDYMFVVIDKKKDYEYIYQNGFKINGITYKRLLGTTGGVKNSTIVFVNEKLLPELKKRIANGRNPEKKFAPAKLEAYQALTCSASTPVSMPYGIAVVKDCFTKFKEDIIHLDDTPDGCTQPIMAFKKDYEIELDVSDGYGLGMPSLMKKWGNDLQLGYQLSGCVIRNSFCKGSIVCIDFQEFAAENGIDEITDVWGETHKIKDIEIVITESMLKLWDSYSSINDYLSNCEKNGYTFAITKPCVEYLENERTMNYQFLQGYDFTDEQIKELIRPTVKEIKDILLGDINKTILYMNGTEMNEKNMQNYKNDFSTALMIDKRMINDPFVKSKIKNMIRKRIDEAKIGVLNVEGNYSLVCGDPYALCQSMLGLEVTGLLNKYEVYSEYWLNKGVDKVAGFRAPMSCQQNVRLLTINKDEKCKQFYRYLHSVTVLNVWDSLAPAMNGLDYDGDCVVTVSTPVIVENTENMPTIFCEQRSADKCVPTEDDFYKSNIDSFGNGVGSVTNRITTMKEVQAAFEKGSEEYKELEYRIMCGQLYQQNEIDKTKGIKVKPMPKEWYDYKGFGVTDEDTEEDIERKEFNKSIVAKEKPYFMRYIYPEENNKYKKYIDEVNNKSLMLFRVGLEELLKKETRTEDEEKFIEYYNMRNPLGMRPCTINKICWKIEEEFDKFFDGYMDSKEKFDYSILKSDVEYSKENFNKINKLYKEYTKCYSNFTMKCKKERVSNEDKVILRGAMKNVFEAECYKICDNPYELANIVLDICYNTKNSKQFAWDICGDIFIKNILNKNNNKISFPSKDKDGDISYKGDTFSVKTIVVKEEMEDK